MATKQNNNDSLNSIRTTLLLLVNNELSNLKKNNKTKINSKILTEVENYYSSANNYLIKLKEEKFVPNFNTGEVIQNKNFKSKFSFESPDVKNMNFIQKTGIMSNDNNAISMSNINPGIKFKNLKENFQLDLLLFSKKSDVSSKKNEYFKIRTLKINSDDVKINENVNNNGILINKPKRKSTMDITRKIKDISIQRNNELINNHNININNIKTKMRTEKAYNYLQSLAKELKIIKKKKYKFKLDYDEMTKAISENNLMKDESNNNNISQYQSNDNKLKISKNQNLCDKDSFYHVSEKEEKNNRSEEKREIINDQENNFMRLCSLNLISNNDNVKLKKIKSEKKLERNRIKRDLIAKSYNNIIESKPNLIQLNQCENLNFDQNDIDLKENQTKDNVLKSFKSHKIIKDIILDNSFDENKNSSNSNKTNNDINTPESNANSNIFYDSNSNKNKLSFTISRNNSFCNNTEKFNNIVLISAADSFKSLKRNSFKIQLKTIEDEKSKSTISNNDFNDNNENIFMNTNLDSEYKKLKFIEIKPIQIPKLNIFSDKFDHIENSQSENIYDNEKISFKDNINNQEKLMKIPHKLQLERITALENKNLRKNSSLYFNSSDSNPDNSDDNNKENKDFYSKMVPLSERRNTKKVESKKIFRMKEINFLNSVDIKEKKNKSILDSDKSSKIKYHYLHSTDTSSFIQLKKIQNEEYSNSREKIDQSKLINLLTNEIDDEIDENLNNNFIDESKIKEDNEIIKLNKISFHNIRDSNTELKFVKLLKCKTSEDAQEYGDNKNVYKTNDNLKLEEESNDIVNNNEYKYRKSIDQNYKKIESGIINNQITQLNNDDRDYNSRIRFDNQKLKHSKTLYNKKANIKNKINSEDNLKSKYSRIDIIKKEEKVKAAKLNKAYENNIQVSNSRKIYVKGFQDENLIGKFDADDYYDREYKIEKRFSFNSKNKFHNKNDKNNPENEQLIYNKENQFEIKKAIIQLNPVENFISEEGEITERYSKEKRKVSFNKATFMNQEKADFKIKLHECSPNKKHLDPNNINKNKQNKNL